MQISSDLVKFRIFYNFSKLPWSENFGIFGHFQRFKRSQHYVSLSRDINSEGKCTIDLRLLVVRISSCFF